MRKAEIKTPDEYFPYLRQRRMEQERKIFEERYGLRVRRHVQTPPFVKQLMRETQDSTYAFPNIPHRTVPTGTRVVYPHRISERAKLISDENTLRRLAPDWNGHAQEQ